MRVQGSRIIFFYLGFVFTLAACTRSVPAKIALKINVPASISSMASSNKLVYVAINARVDQALSAPNRVWTYSDGKVPLVTQGQTYFLTIEDNIPQSAKLFIQYLGVYEDSVGLMTFTYGATAVDSTKTGDIVANIAALIYNSTSSKEGHVSGRYLEGTGAGPTGQLVMYFNPDNGGQFVGHPLMAVDESEMFAGWFGLFALDGAGLKFTYKVKKTDISGVVTESPMQNFSDVNLATIEALPGTQAKLQVMSRPLALSVNSGSNPIDIRNLPASDYVFGFFTNGYTGASTFLATTNLCYSYLTTEDIPNYFTSYTDAVTNTPLTYGATCTPAAPPSNTNLCHGSGAGVTAAYFMTSPTLATCNSISTSEFSDFLRFYHWRLDGGGGESHAVGFSGPFQIYAPGSTYQGYISISSTTLSWTYLPGIFISSGNPNNAIDGADVYFRLSSSGNTGGDDHNDERLCQDKLVASGFSLLGNAPATGSTGSYTLGSMPNSGDEFALCPYRVINGAKRYYRIFVQEHAP